MTNNSSNFFFIISTLTSTPSDIQSRFLYFKRLNPANLEIFSNREIALLLRIRSFLAINNLKFHSKLGDFAVHFLAGYEPVFCIDPANSKLVVETLFRWVSKALFLYTGVLLIIH